MRREKLLRNIRKINKRIFFFESKFRMIGDLCGMFFVEVDILGRLVFMFFRGKYCKEIEV